AEQGGGNQRLVPPQRPVPAQREPGPGRGEPRIVEGQHDHQRDGPEQEGVAEGQRRGQGAGAPHVRASRFWNSAIGTTSSTSSSIASAEASGKSRFWKNSAHSTRPMSWASGPPSSSGITNSPTAGMNTSISPARMPGSDNGRVTARKARQGRAPRSSAASSST